MPNTVTAVSKARDRVSIPVCVDLDGTLIKTDLLYERIARLLKQKPWLVALIPFWLFYGKATLKARLAERIELDVTTLPYDHKFIEWLAAEKATGRELVLITNADEALARRIAAHVGLGSSASDNPLILTGDNKLALIRDRFHTFDYAASSSDSVTIWQNCNTAITVDASSSVIRSIQQHVRTVMTFDNGVGRARHYVRALRPHQWVKNLLIFVPLVTSHLITNPELFLKAAIGALLFSLCSSSQYILNDILDVEADRRHTTKRRRPFASGMARLSSGLVLAPVLLLISLVGGLLLSTSFAVFLATYFICSLAYSMYIKRVLLLDIFVLSGLYMFRIVVGHFVTNVAFSVWLLSFAFFVFLSLAFSKRCAELTRAQRSGMALIGRSYGLQDSTQMNVFGVCSAFLSAVVFMLYLQTDRIRSLYGQPELLWLLCPVFLYWITRIWIVSARGDMTDDPIVFVLRDRTTYVIAAIAAMVMVAAKTGKWASVDLLH